MKAKFYWGKTGSGKTLKTTIDVITDLGLGREIWGNMHFKGIPYNYVDLIDLVNMVVSEEHDITTPTRKTLVLDEIKTLFDGRRSSTSQNQILSIFVSQCRKRGFNIIYNDQFISGADTRLRQLTDKLVRCIPIRNYSDIGLGTVDNPEPVAFRYITLDLQSYKVTTRKIPRWIARIFYPYYNTYEVIRPEVDYVSS